MGSLGSDIANIGNAASGIIPQSTAAGNAVPATPSIVKPTAAPQINNGTLQAIAGQSTVPVNPTPANVTGLIPTVANPQLVPTQSISPTAAPSTGVTGAVTQPVNAGQNTDIYGATGSLINQLESEETPGNADSLAQTIINANAPNVAQGSSQLNTGLAAAGISPSSSVSAIENANYQGQVSQQDASEIAQVNLQEQQMQQQLAESLLPSAQKQNTDSSAWSIFGDVMSGVGDVATAALNAGGGNIPGID